MARNAILGIKEGYANHPQLERFKKQENPINFIDTYLLDVYNESVRRNYNFNREKLGSDFTNSKIKVTEGQITYEIKHLKRKLKIRDEDRYDELSRVQKVDLNSVFKLIKGDIASWERPY